MTNPIDLFYQNTNNKWIKELNLLREIALECNLKEEYKWKQPCYTYNNKNIVIVGPFKNYCALLFFKGSLLSDVNNILVTPTENSQSGRQIRFTNIKEIEKLKPLIKSTIFEAIEIEKQGLKINLKTVDEFDIPVELKNAFIENPLLKESFNNLTPGRKKGYYLHFNGAKQSKTRISRIEKVIPKIMQGKGMNDCTCGLSKKMPSCDGSHKQLN